MNFSADLIASQVGGVVEGDGSITVNTFAKIEEAKSGSITFLANPKYTHFIYSTDASIVLVRKDFVAEHPVKATLIRVDDPYQTLSHLLKMVSDIMNVQPKGIEQPSHISETAQLGDDCYVGAFAYIGNNVKIGRNVKIYPQAYVGDGVSIGDDSIIYPGVKIYKGCQVGARCILHAGVVIGADGFGFAPTADGSYDKIPQIGVVILDDDVEIGANTTVDRATMGCTHIKQGVKLDNLIQVAHNVEIGRNTVMAAQAGVAGSAKIGENCMFGGQVGIAGHINIGNRVQIGAQTGVPNSVGDDLQLMGYPAVKAKDFMRQSVYVKRLGELFDRVNKLEKNK
jgi:UDP-3-O-[3-hydroxymyristoyl] glucosamine N-acyltransferase